MKWPIEQPLAGSREPLAGKRHVLWALRLPVPGYRFAVFHHSARQP